MGGKKQAKKKMQTKIARRLHSVRDSVCGVGGGGVDMRHLQRRVDK